MASVSNNNILIINAHPSKSSFCTEISKRYYKGATNSGAKAELINLVDLDIDWISKGSNTENTPVEGDIQKIQNLISNSSHIVFVFPNWWGTFPAILKGFFDRVLVRGFAYKYVENSPFPKALLKGKSARIIMTMDTPIWYYRLIYRSPGLNAMKRSVLSFCGIKPVKTTIFTPVRSSGQKKREGWLNKAEKLGEKNL